MSTEIKEVFITEAQEVLQHLESDIVQLEEERDAEESVERLHRIFRCVHTLKGSSGIAGFSEIYDFTHSLESLLDLVRNEKLTVNREIIDIVLNSIDWIKMVLFGTGDIDDLVKLRERLLNKIHNYIPKPDSSEAIENKDKEEETEKSTTSSSNDNSETREIGFRYFRIRAIFKEDIFNYGIDPLLIIEDLTELGIVVEKKILLSNFPDFFEFDPEKCYSGWDLTLKTKQSLKAIEDVFLFVIDDNKITIEDITSKYTEDGDSNAPPADNSKIGEIMIKKGILTENEFQTVLGEQNSANKKMGQLAIEKGYATEKDVSFALEEQEKIKKHIETHTIRIDAKKLDNLMNLLGEIVIGQSSISRISDELDEEKSFQLKNALYGLDRTTRQFQEQLMSIRMIPIGPTFEQFRRFVRDTANSLNKKIQFKLVGKETELDKTVIDRISDPLKHMIRNAIDHGIETPEERQKKNKPAEGQITLEAYHQEGSIYIDVRDDGKGLDTEKIRARAENLGLLKADAGTAVRDLYSLLFLPGFSTAEDIGDLSGRGVGMDVVKTNIESLRGSIEIESELNKGTLFRIKLPLTLAIIEGMLVQVSNNIFIIPLLSIVESIQPNKEDLKTIEGKGEVLMVRGEYISHLRLYQEFNLEPIHENPWEGLVIIVESAGKRIGLMVDDLLGQQQIVIKNIGNSVTASRSISGAAILGDGKVALILDVNGLMGEINSVEKISVKQGGPLS